MGETSKSYRIKANVGADSFLSVNLEQDYDVIDILSLKIDSQDLYRLHNSNYGVVVGRVLANNGFGVPNAKISIFIGRNDDDDEKILAIYPYTSPSSKDESGVRYNLLPDEKVGDCHQVVGTFPNKRYMLDNEDLIEVFDKYYKYTTRTNNAGDYIICGVPTGNQQLHMDLDLSDCGILSQRPRDFVYKGYTIEQFENPNMFKGGTEYTTLSQIFSQDQSVYVRPFWGNESLGEEIGITRADINVAFKFEPTCVFMGCVVSDNSSQGISKKCIPTPHMGDMDELVTGEGTIEMIRKTYAGSVEEFQVKGTELINGDGIWCYQIPMNLDYMMTDEYGNMVPTDNPDKGIPTRTRVRFRISMQDMEHNVDNYFRPKVLVPHNPQVLDGTDYEPYDYEFGSFTSEESFRDLFWNEVYTVKSYIPRFQKRKTAGWKGEYFTGIKHCQDYGKNNPIPYNNIRIRMPFMFKVMCILIKIFIKIVKIVNTVISMIGNGLAEVGHIGIRAINWYPFGSLYDEALKLKMNVIDEGMCPDLENWYFAPVYGNPQWSPKKVPKGHKRYNLLKQTLESINTDDDPTSIDDQNQDTEDVATCLTINTDYLISCIEMNLAQEYKVINFDFYNDWINGMIYIPRFMRYVRKKRKFLGLFTIKAKVKGCMDDKSIFSKTRRYTQLCSVGFKKHNGVSSYEVYSKTEANLKNWIQVIKSNNLHKKRGIKQEKIFGKKKGGICHEKETMYGHHVYYLKPCEWTLDGTPTHRKINLYATDIVLLGSLNSCDLHGLPQAFKHLSSSSYIMPTNLALTNMEENGPLYAYGTKGTICSKQNQTEITTNPDDLSRPVGVVSSNAPLASELQFYSGASSNYDVMYDDPSDTIAMTEAAGIAWNYTGPGQGEIDKRRLYYPGGHFLGLSCVNSQTNIKSCINLERICEQGTSMSQRREDVRAVSSNDATNEMKLEYTYSVPTGLISGDDVIDDEFRVMFATMNHNRLVADKIDPNTGYKMYDFMYVNPINFGGELSKYTGNGTPYNQMISVIDESAQLEKFGIKNATEREDYDPNEVINTRARTIEFPSVDYYMFRFGLNYDDIKPKREKHLRKFAKVEDGLRYLPQYENSFYFYFGTKDGATALDEFNKQFFSECESSTLIERESASYVVVGDFDLCTGTSDVIPYIKNMGSELRYTLEFGENTVDRDGRDVIHGKWDDENSVEEIISLPSGKYNLKVVDEEGTELTSNFTIGERIIDGILESFDFNVPLENNYLPRTSANSNMFYGGYIKCEGVKVNGAEDLQTLELVAVLNNANPYLINARGVRINNGKAEKYLEYANTTYDIYVLYQIAGCLPVYIFMASVNLLETSSVDLTIGPILKTSCYQLNKTLLNNGTNLYKDINWWKLFNNASTEKFANYDERLKWDIRRSIVKTDAGHENTFSNNVVPVNGIKAIFGTPQNSNRLWPQNIIKTTEQDSQIPEGYSLDDDASYYETYGVPEYNSCRQYNASSYKGVTVSGEFVGKIVNAGVRDIKSCSADLYLGQGCLFKPLPEGQIIPAEYLGGEIKCLVDDSQDVEYDTGIVYPTVVYPVAKNPFFVNANYFLLKTSVLEENINEVGEYWAEPVKSTTGVKCEARIENGLTYGCIHNGRYRRYYGGESYMSLITDDDATPGTNEFEASTGSDLANIVPTNCLPPSITYLTGWTEDKVERLNFSIQEGAPFYANGTSYSACKFDGYSEYDKTSEYSTIAETAEIEQDYSFYDEVSFMRGNSTMMFEATGNSDPDIEYYVAPVSTIAGSNGLIEKDMSNEGYIYTDVGPSDTEKSVMYLLGRYTAKAQYDPKGKEVVVKLFDPNGWLFNSKRPRATIPFTKYDSSKDMYYIEYETERLEDIGTALSVKDIRKAVNEIKDEFNGRVDFDRKYKVKEAAKTRIESDRNSWTNLIENSIISASNKIEPAGGAHSKINSEIVIVGKKTVKNGATACENIYMIYTNPVEKILNTVSADVIRVTYNGQYISELVSPNVASSFSCKVEVLSGAQFNYQFVDGSSWCSVNETSTTTNGDYKVHNITIRTTENSSFEERTAKIKFSATVDRGDGNVEYVQNVSIRQLKSTEEVEGNLGTLSAATSSFSATVETTIDDIHTTIDNMSSGNTTQPTDPIIEP